MMLQSMLSLIETYLGAIDAWLCRVEKKAYEARFKECMTLLVQILLAIKARLLQIPIPVIALKTLQTGEAKDEGSRGIYVFAR